MAGDDGNRDHAPGENAESPLEAPTLEPGAGVGGVPDGDTEDPLEVETLEPGSGVPPAPKTWGRLDVVRRIGRGGFGDVFQAVDRETGQEFALKLARIDVLVDLEAQNLFLEQAQALARVRHPNVLAVEGAERISGRVGLWGELVDGETLEQILDAHGPLDVEEAARVGIELCGALAAVHEAGLVHHDVKTANVMRDKNGRIILMDFGAVSDMPSAERIGGIDCPGGTPLFMAPELLRGKDSGTATDIYSVGVVLYRLVTHSYPIDTRSLTELVQSHYRKKAVPLGTRRRHLPAPFVQVVDKALHREPGHRHKSVTAMAQALLDALQARGKPSGGLGRFWPFARS